MKTRVLVSVASKHGSTAEIGRVIGDALQDKGFAVDIVPPGAVDSLDGYDAVILGSAVYLGHWLTVARDFAVRFRDELAARPVWLFSSGPVGDPSERLAWSLGREPADVAAIRRDVRPWDHRVFAGRLDPELLGLPHASHLIFHGISGDFRDWDEITRWADDIADQLAMLHDAAVSSPVGHPAQLR
jgi:menaquinone-dependent protoporphyrinogen oxidase